MFQRTQCNDVDLKPTKAQRGEYYVLFNYIRATSRFRCAQSITFTTHGDIRFLDNLLILTDRWRGPISVAVHTPGEDFITMLEAIWHLRECSGTTLIKEYVTFHFYFHHQHAPEEVYSPEKAGNLTFDCTKPRPYINVNTSNLYKSKNELIYPVNLARNIARDSSQTHYVLAADIELYPSLGIIDKFLTMIAESNDPRLKRDKIVFSLHPFEVEKNQTIPNTKTELRKLLKTDMAVPFHKFVCKSCHYVPKGNQWQEAEETQGLSIFDVGKRIKTYGSWEPVYIGTKSEPFYDERLSWEGKKDKITHSFLLCIEDYDFLLLDNVYLVHRPGIKKYVKDNSSQVYEQKTNDLLKNEILPEIKKLYGTTEDCVIYLS